MAQMKKRSYLLMLVALFGFSLSAQNEGKVTIVETIDKYKVETNKFWNNWFIAAGGGFQMYLVDHNKQMDFIDRVSPAVNISLGKWFTPGVGMRFSYAGRKVKGATQNGSYSTGERYWEEPHWLDKQEFDYNHYYADVMFNLTNLIAGYNPKHWFNVSPYIGAGLLTNVSGGERRREIGGNIGFLFGLNVNKYFDINLDVRGTMIGDAFDGEVGGSKFDGIISTTLGLAYKFPKRGWDKRVIITKTIDRSEEITVLNNEINELRATN